MCSILAGIKQGLTRLLEVLLILAAVLLVLDVAWVVWTRYGMGEQAEWAEQLARYLVISVLTLGGALTVAKKGFTQLIEFLLVLTVALLVLDVVWGVFTRYAMEEQAEWTEELARFLLVWVSLLGGAVAFKRKAHLGVDYFVGKFEPGVRKMAAIFSHLVVLFFAVTIFLYGGSRVVLDALAMEQMTPALGWKMGHVYLALPIAGLFMAIFTIENIIETLAPPTALEEADSAEEVG